MSYKITFIDSVFIVEYNYKNHITIYSIEYIDKYKYLRDFLINNKFIELTIDVKENYFFLTTTNGLKLYETKWFCSLTNTNDIYNYDIAKIVYLFYDDLLCDIHLI